MTLDFTKVMEAYRDIFGPGSIGFMEPDGGLVIIPDDENENRVYFVPDWETPDGFQKKLQEAKTKGREVFYLAYRETFRDPYPEDALY